MPEADEESHASDGGGTTQDAPIDESARDCWSVPRERVRRTSGVHLAVDAVGAKYGGAADVVLGMLAAAWRCQQVRHVTLFCSPKAKRRFSVRGADWLDVEERHDEESSKLARINWLTGGLARRAQSHGAEALLALNGACGGRSGMLTTVFAQQAIPLSMEAMSRFAANEVARMLAIRALLWDACRHSRWVAVQTPWMRDALVDQLGADRARVVVVGTTSRFAPADQVSSDPLRSRMTADVALYVGSDDPHKNVGVLAPAIRTVRRRRPHARLLATIRPALGLNGVTCLGYLEPQALLEAYSAATVLVFPSLVESAGLPLLEAMALGVPIVAADRPYARDICGDAALYVDPCDPAAIADGLLQVMDSWITRRTLVQQGAERAAALYAVRPYDKLVELAVSAPTQS